MKYRALCGQLLLPLLGLALVTPGESRSVTAEVNPLYLERNPSYDDALDALLVQHVEVERKYKQALSRSGLLETNETPFYPVKQHDKLEVEANSGPLDQPSAPWTPRKGTPWYVDAKGLLKVQDRQPRHVHLAYGRNSSEVVVTWSTLSYAGQSLVEWGSTMFDLSSTNAGSSSRFVDGGSLRSTQYIHRVHLYGLAPNSTYYYHVGGHRGWSPVFGFRTVPAGTTGWPLTLAVYGDLGVVNSRSLTRLQQEAHQGVYDAVLHVGDLAYDMNTDNGTMGDRFMEMMEPIGAYLQYMTCPGNHESADDFLQYRSRFSMPNYTETESLYYSFDLGPVHFVAVSTEVYYYRDQMERVKAQYQWLEADLKAANAPAARAARPWILVFGHRPMYCSTRDGDDCTKVHCRTRVGLHHGGKYVYGLEPVLAKYGVDLAIWAHEHAYERLYPVYNYTVYAGEDPYVNPKAPVHITTGSAGCQERLDPWLPDQPDFTAFRLNRYGYTRLRVHNSTHLQWQQVLDADGSIGDEVVLVREEHGPYDVLSA